MKLTQEGLILYFRWYFGFVVSACLILAVLLYAARAYVFGGILQALGMFVIWPFLDTFKEMRKLRERQAGQHWRPRGERL